VVEFTLEAILFDGPSLLIDQVPHDQHLATVVSGPSKDDVGAEPSFHLGTEALEGELRSFTFK